MTSTVQDKVEINCSFTTIAKATADAIANAKAGSLTAKEVKAIEVTATTRIAGFDVEVPAKKVEAVDLTINRLAQSAEKFATDKSVLEGQMLRAGIEPLAYLPTNAWAQLSLKAGLYTFHNENYDGTVNVKPNLRVFGQEVAYKAKMAGFEDDLHGPIFWAVCILSGVLSTIYLLPTLTDIKVFAIHYVPAYALSAVIAFFAPILSQIFFQSHRRNLRKALKEKGGIHKFYWPSQQEPVSGQDSVKVIFPTPPENVKAILLKAYQADMKMMTTLDAAAIGFAENQFSTLLGIVKRQDHILREEEKARQAAISADPIIWVQHGSAVAILAQYGKFPIEEALVVEVMRDFTFSVDDYQVAVQ